MNWLNKWWQHLADELNSARESGDEDRIENAEWEMLSQGAFFDAYGLWTLPNDAAESQQNSESGG